ncbi:MAG TPA: CsgG/HfaB family protein [Verrucomicrobiae bacterium]|jgi:curli biogenesis system outer membrane secretion channel CsgG|nr:CsgG/HfaB family protein [Verrucomicrobiae bacterium]
MRRVSISTFVLFALFVSLACGQQPKKKRVAILDFDYGTVRSDVAAIYGTDQDVGKGITDMLVDRLVNDGTYSVIERKALDKILAEQNFSNSDRADPASAAKIGKLLGVSAIIVGSITQFGRDDKSTTVGGGGAGVVSRHFGFGGAGVGKKEAKAVVQITARIVDVNTGEILASAQGLGQSKRSGTSLSGVGGGSGGGGGGMFDSHASNFGATLIGEATNTAVTELATKLDASGANLPTVVVAIDGLVADVSGSTLILNVGKNQGINVGDSLKVTHAGREIKDPATGKVLRRVETDMGVVTITQVDDTSATGTYSGTAGVKVGDHVKRQ